VGAGLVETGERDHIRPEPTPKLEELDWSKVVESWRRSGQPEMEFPGLSVRSSGSVLIDLAELQTQSLTSDQQAYVAQQLWPSIPEMLTETKAERGRWRVYKRRRIDIRREITGWIPAPKTLRWAIVPLLLVAAGTYCYMDARLEKDHYDEALSEQFLFATYEVEPEFQAQDWYEAPPWDEFQAVVQLIERIRFLSTDSRYADALEVAAPEADVLPVGGGFPWQVTFPSLPDVDVGKTVWYIYEDGGFQYRNAQADKLTHCAGASQFEDVITRLPHTLTKNERELPCDD
jgi:hypothetical protein